VRRRETMFGAGLGERLDDLNRQLSEPPR